MGSAKELENVRVLVVEDHKDSRAFLQEVLEIKGAIVSGVDSVDEALLEVDDFIPDVIVSDLMMPERDGFDLIRCLHGQLERDRTHKTPVIAVTGCYDERSGRARTLAEGFEGFLMKPYNSKSMVNVVARLALRGAADNQLPG